MVKYTRANLKRLEELFKALQIAIRYEKGNFQSGYCIVAGKNMVIVNTFFDPEARMNILLEILETGNFDMSGLPDDLKEWYKKIMKSIPQPSM
jgi:hypothetical protein